MRTRSYLNFVNLEWVPDFCDHGAITEKVIIVIIAYSGWSSNRDVVHRFVGLIVQARE